MSKIWVPIIGDGTDDDHFRPNAGVPHNDAVIPCDLATGIPACSHATVEVPDASAVATQVLEANVPWEARLFVRVVRECRANGTDAENAIVEIAKTLNQMQRQKLRRVVVLAAQRGLISLDRIKALADQYGF